MRKRGGETLEDLKLVEFPFISLPLRFLAILEMATGFDFSILAPIFFFPFMKFIL